MAEDAESYTVATAREAAARDELGAWVGRFLASPGSDNAGLAALLADPPRHWLGPVLLPIDRLLRLAGPSGHPVVREVEDHEWRDDVADLAEKIDDGLEPAPVVVTCRDEGLHLEDGNHRVEASRQAGEDHVWAVVAFDDPDARDHFVERTRLER
jgi:hypothetical protein